jgi:hypothetical protein
MKHRRIARSRARQSTLRKSQILVRRSNATSISASTQAKTCEPVESVQITVNGSTQRLIQQDDLGGCAVLILHGGAPTVLSNLQNPRSAPVQFMTSRWRTGTGDRTRARMFGVELTLLKRWILLCH